MMDACTWNDLIASLPDPHVLQTWEWGQVKADFGWQPIYKTWPEDGEGTRKAHLPAAAALILQRAVPIRGFAARLRVLYVPKGPLLDWSDVLLRKRVLADLRTLARRQSAIFIKIDPDVRLGTGIPEQDGAQEDLMGQAVLAELQANGWRFSDEQIQFRNTVQIDLRPAEDELVARMKQKTRYNIRLAERKRVTVRGGSPADLESLYQMYAETSLRDGFVIRDKAYYLAVWKAFMESGRPDGSVGGNRPTAEPLIAEVEGEAIAALIIFRFAGKAWYMYGMSRTAHRDKMPNYILQWEAIRRAKAAGCRVYDLWGAPDQFHDGDPLWGVYRFKEGLGGSVVRTGGAWDLPLNPLFYRLYSRTLPRFLDLMRRRGRASTLKSVIRDM